MRTRHVPIILPADEYSKLAEMAKAEERDPLQQARWILRQAISRQQDTSRLEVRDGRDR